MLSGVDLAVEPGEVIAVCGPTGAGKTSLLNLLPRFYDPTDGRVLVGGVDVRDVALAELRNAVAIVTQKPILFSIPLRDNLTAARPDAPWDEVVAAAEAAGVAHFAADLPDGYDTLIGERGINLSGGQRQRVALARALVAGARVDRARRPDVGRRHADRAPSRRDLRPALAGRTVLIAAQRLSTVEVADRAVVLDDGVIVELGSPAELLALGGVFAALFGEEIVLPRKQTQRPHAGSARYLGGRWLRVAVLSVIGICSAARP